MIDLAIRDGEFMTVLGPSGSGKTTDPPPDRRLRRAEPRRDPARRADISAMPINRRPFNTVFQDYALFPHMTVEANVGYGLQVRGVPKAEIRERVAETLALVRARAISAGAIPSQLSGGQQQRVALARAIICEPRLILLDEPLGALDAELRRQMQRFLKRLQREIRTTFLFVTHDQEEAVTMADRICVMNHGRIEQIGTPQEVYYRPAQRVCRPLLRRQQPHRRGSNLRQRRPPHRRTPLGSFRCPSRTVSPTLRRRGPRPSCSCRPRRSRLGAARIQLLTACAVRSRRSSFVGPVSHVSVRALAQPNDTDDQAAEPRPRACRFAVGSETEIGWSDRGMSSGHA